MKFLDANVLVHAYHMRPRYSKDEVEIKRRARAITDRVDEGESVAISVVHVSEVANILSRVLDAEKLAVLLKTLMTKENITILEVGKMDYLAAIEESAAANIGVNDCLTHVLMLANGITEIYSFDRDFDRFGDVKRIDK